MIKRILSLVVVFCMVVGIMPMGVFAEVEDGFTAGNLKYKVISEGDGDNTVTLIGYETEPKGELTVTESVYKEGNSITYTVVEIGVEAFKYCYDITQVTLPDSVKTIGKEAFYNCPALATVDLGNSLENIGESAFAMSRLTTVHLPASLETIGEDAFGQCYDLTKFTVDNGNQNFPAVDGVLYNKDKTELILYPGGKAGTSFEIPNSVVTIGKNAFKFNRNLKSITIGDSVTTIEKGAFAYCENLTEITIGKNVKTIGEEAFLSCESLENIIFHANSNLKEIGEKAFGSCIAIVSLDLPDLLETIGENAFGYCNNLESITMGPNVSTIGKDAFYVVNKLSSLTIDENNSHYKAVEGVLYNKNMDTLIIYVPAKSNTSFTVPNTVNKIEENAFYACDYLENVTIPASVNSIGEYAFHWAEKIESISFLGTTPPIMGDYIFTYCKSLTSIYVPEGSEEAYIVALANCDLENYQDKIKPVVVDEPQSPYGLYVGTVIVDDSNKNNITGSELTGSISYNPNTKTLTLNNATIDSTSNGIHSMEDINIVLIGNNTIGRLPTDYTNLDDYSVWCGIQAFGKDVNVIGNGDLSIYDRSMGITGKNINININGKLTIKEYGAPGMACCLKADGGTLTIEKGNLDLYSYLTNNLFGNLIIIKSGSIEAKTDSIDVNVFNVKPSFDANYKYKVYAGNDKGTATEVVDFSQDVYTNSKYIRIEQKPDPKPDPKPEKPDPKPDDGGSGGGTGGGGGGSTTPTQPTTPTPTLPTTPTEPTIPIQPPTPEPAVWENPFTDIKEDTWYYSAVKYVQEKGLMSGVGTNDFAPNKETTRGMIVTILHRLAGIPTVEGVNPFADVKTDKYYGNSAIWASANNIVSGYGDGKFGPEDSITREQLAVILMNFTKLQGYDITNRGNITSFTDNGDISTWAKDAMSWANALGLINGKGNNTLDPNGAATRAEVAIILERFIERFMGE